MLHIIRDIILAVHPIDHKSSGFNSSEDHQEQREQLGVPATSSEKPSFCCNEESRTFPVNFMLRRHRFYWVTFSLSSLPFLLPCSLIFFPMAPNFFLISRFPNFMEEIAPVFSPQIGEELCPFHKYGAKQFLSPKSWQVTLI